MLNKAKETRHAAGRAEGTYPPFSQGEDGKLTGFADFAEALAKFISGR
ncbi:hypothetical protein KCP70_00800 [Salmonella enterica subsp. enterica]|nr:hypothetical protein KCP70_00800 [Salmonella enterica subsp. enterica]